MTGFLLDTHVVLWWLASPETLSAEARQAVSDGRHAVFVSAAAGWEMAIKKTLGRLDFPANLEDVLAQDRIEVLPITLAHALAVGDLPLRHQDPFDRVQVAQARAEDLVFVTRDPIITEYDVEVLEA